jgi:hypothetical protein
MGSMDLAAIVTLLLLGGVGLAILVAWGVQAFLIYMFFALVAVVIAVGLRISAGWWEDVSRSRFDRRDRS